MSRIFLFLMMIMISMNLFALACPNGQGILYKGDSIEEVIKQCGEPTNKRTITNNIYSLQKWIYVKNYSFNQGFLQMELFFTNNRVSRIHMTDRNYNVVCRSGVVQVGVFITTQQSCGDWIYDLTYTNYCGPVFGIGDTTETVGAMCGKPWDYQDLQSKVSEQTELFYGGSQPQIIVFQDGKLVDWK